VQERIGTRPVRGLVAIKNRKGAENPVPSKKGQGKPSHSPSLGTPWIDEKALNTWKKKKERKKTGIKQNGNMNSEEVEERGKFEGKKPAEKKNLLLTKEGGER